MVIPLGKLTIIIGAGLVGSVLSKEGRLSDVTSLFSGALKIVTKQLQHDKDSPQSTSKPHTDTLLAQVNTLRQELQLLASSRSVTIVTGSRSGSGTIGVTTVIVIVGFVGLGYVYIRRKGWKISEMMFVTSRGFSDVCNSIGKRVDLVSSSVSSTRSELSSSINCVESNVNECKKITSATKEEVSKLHGDLSVFHKDVASVHHAVQTLERKLGKIEENQDVATEGVSHLCKFVKKLVRSRNPELIEGSASSSHRAIEPPQHTAITRMSSMPTLALQSRSSPCELSKVLHSPKSVSISGLKISNTIVRMGSTKPLNGTSSTEEPRTSWRRLPGLSILSRTCSTDS